MINNVKKHMAWISQIIRRDLAVFLTPMLIILILTPFYLLQSDNSVYAILVAVASGIILSSILGFTAHFFLRYGPSERGLTLVHFIFLPILGIILMCAGVIFVLNVPQGKWHTLPPPPERAIKILPSDATWYSVNISIRSVSGREFTIVCKGYQKDCEWSEIQPGSSLTISQEDDSCDLDLLSGFKKSPPIFERIIDIYQKCFRGVESSAYMKVVILEGGSIQLWTYFEGVDTLFNVAAFAFIGFIAGLATSITTIVLRVRRKKSYLKDPNNPDIVRFT